MLILLFKNSASHVIFFLSSFNPKSTQSLQKSCKISLVVGTIVRRNIVDDLANMGEEPYVCCCCWASNILERKNQYQTRRSGVRFRGFVEQMD